MPYLQPIDKALHPQRVQDCPTPCRSQRPWGHQAQGCEAVPWRHIEVILPPTSLFTRWTVADHPGRADGVWRETNQRYVHFCPWEFQRVRRMGFGSYCHFVVVVLQGLWEPVIFYILRSALWYWKKNLAVGQTCRLLFCLTGSQWKTTESTENERECLWHVVCGCVCVCVCVCTRPWSEQVVC